jgi:hypothetical protein
MRSRTTVQSAAWLATALLLGALFAPGCAGILGIEGYPQRDEDAGAGGKSVGGASAGRTSGGAPGTAGINAAGGMSASGGMSANGGAGGDDASGGAD